MCWVEEAHTERIMDRTEIESRLASFPRMKLAQTPTPIEPCLNLSRSLGIELFVKRDDYTGIGFGGNKVRQLEYYFGEAQSQNADTILITGAVQSNFARTTAAIASKLDMSCHIQMEERVDNVSDLYRSNGNVILSRLMGATFHHYPDGEDEAGADAAIFALADELRSSGNHPYVIPLAVSQPPLGSLGYVNAALELSEQMDAMRSISHIVIASGSAITHTGLLYGLRVLGIEIPVTGVCVRRDAVAQKTRVNQRVGDLAELLDIPVLLSEDDVSVFDGCLEPGYGRLNNATQQAISLAARLEGLILDPVYTGKTMAGLMALVELGQLQGDRVLFWHTGGQPGLFAYADQV